MITTPTLLARRSTGRVCAGLYGWLLGTSCPGIPVWLWQVTIEPTVEERRGGQTHGRPPLLSPNLDSTRECHTPSLTARRGYPVGEGHMPLCGWVAPDPVGLTVCTP